MLEIGECRRRPALALLLLSLAVSCDADVREAHSYPIKDSGYKVPGAGGLVEGNLFWMDNERVLFKGAEADDYVTLPGNRRVLRPGLHIWNTRTGEVELYTDEVPEFGFLCYRNGYVNYVALADGRNVFRAGQLGAERDSPTDRDVPRDRERTLNPVTCSHYVRRELVDFGVNPLPLFEPGEVLALGDRHYKEPIRYFLPGKSAPVILPIFGRDLHGPVYYSTYRNALVLPEMVSMTGQSTTRRYFVVDRQARMTETVLPAGPWMDASVAGMPTARGWFMASLATADRAEGGYLVNGTEAKRVIRGFPLSFAVSPDGCKVAISITGPGPIPETAARLKLIEVCTKRN